MASVAPGKPFEGKLSMGVLQVFAGIRNWQMRQRHLPGALGIFVNPAFIIRRKLYLSIRELAPTFQGKLLDFGAGAAPYRTLFQNVEIYNTVDIETSGHESENKVSEYYYDGHTLPFPDASFDTVFASEVFEHIFNLPEILRDLHRVLKPGGQMLVTVPFAWEEHEIPFDFARYTSFGLEHVLSKSGFSIERKTKTASYVESVFQLASIYIIQNLFRSPRLLRLLATAFIVAPINTLGLLFGKILPRDERFFLNLIILCKRLPS